MKKVFTLCSVFMFISSIYLMPMLSAITLGDIKSDTKDNIVTDDKAGGGTGKTDTSKKSNEGDKKKDLAKEKDDKAKKDENKPPDETQKVEEINPRLVCLLSVIMPGGGHFYLNNDTKGIAFCIAAGVGYTASGFFMVKTMLAEQGTVDYRNYLLLTGFIFFITLIVHFVGIIEAYSDAEEINKKNLFNGSDDPYESQIRSE